MQNFEAHDELDSNGTGKTPQMQHRRVPKKDLSHLAQLMTDVALPAKRHDKSFWKRTNGDMTITLNASPIQVLSANGEMEEAMFVPYGKYARAIMKHIVAEAKRTGSAEVNLGKTAEELISQLGVKKGGSTYRDVFNQVQAVVSMTIKVETTSTDKDATGRWHSGIEHYVPVSDYAQYRVNAHTGERSDSNERGNFVRLSDKFMVLCVERAVPIHNSDWENLLKNTKSPVALDVYSWLWARTGRSNRPVRLNWKQLHEQFGTTSKDIQAFRKQFKSALGEVFEYTNIPVWVSIYGEGKRTGFRGIVATAVEPGHGGFGSVVEGELTS